MLNNITLMGRITHTPELKQTTSGTSVLSFQLAVDRRFKNGNDKVTDFIDCVAWQQTAEFIARYFSKGDMLAVVGELQTREYTGRDNAKKKAVEVIVSQASFCGGKAEKQPTGNEEQPAGTQQQPQFQDVDFNDDDLPF